MGINGIQNVFWARNVFFHFVKQLVPEVVEELYDMMYVFPSVIEYLSLKYPMNSDLLYLGDILKLLPVENPPASLVQFTALLADWMNRFNLKDPWIVNEIPMVLSMWNRNPDLRRGRCFLYTGVDKYHKHLVPNNVIELFNPTDHLIRSLDNQGELKNWLQPPEPDPMFQTESEYLEMCRVRYRAKRRLLELKGFTEMKEIRKKDSNFMIKDHFIWMIQYQIHRMSYEEIARSYCDDEIELESKERNIIRAVEKLAERIDLTRRAQL